MPKAFPPAEAVPTPGEVLAAAGEIELQRRPGDGELAVLNRGDRPIQVGSHYPFAETNRALEFDRAARTVCDKFVTWSSTSDNSV